MFVQPNPRKSARIVNLLAVVVALLFVASMIGLVNGPALISGAAGMLTAVAGLVVGYLKAVQLAIHES